MLLRVALLAAALCVAICTAADSEDLAWKTLEVTGDIPPPSCDQEGYTYNGHLYIFGGYDESTGEYLMFNDLYRLNLETHVWKMMDVVGAKPQERSAPFHAIVGRYFIVAHGIDVDDVYPQNVWYVDLDADEPLSWVQADIDYSAVDTLPGRVWGTGAKWDDNRMWIFGGFDEVDQRASYLLDVRDWSLTPLEYRCADSGLENDRLAPYTFTLADLVNPENENKAGVSAECPFNNAAAPPMKSLAKTALSLVGVSVDEDEGEDEGGEGGEELAGPAELADALTDIHTKFLAYEADLLAALTDGNATLAAALTSSDEAVIAAGVDAYTAFWQAQWDALLDEPDDGDATGAGNVQCADYWCPALNCTLPPPTQGARARVYEGKMVLYSGLSCGSGSSRGGPECISSDIYVLDQATLEWSKPTISADASMGALSQPPASSFGSIEVVGDELFVIGGAYKDAARDWYYYNTFYALNLTSYTWRQVPTKGALPKERWSATLGYYEQTRSFYWFAGCKAPDLFYNSVSLLFPVTVSPQESAVITANAFAPLLAGATRSVVVQTRDAEGENLIFGGEKVGGFGFEVNGFNYFSAEVTDLGTGTYSVALYSKKAAIYTFSVTLNGEDIAGSPFSLTVTSGNAAPANSELAVASATAGAIEAGRSLSLELNVRDSFGNAATTGTGSQVTGSFSLVGSNDAAGAFAFAVSADGNTVTGSFTPTLPGNYSVTAALDGTPIGSVMYVTVASAVEEDSKTGLFVGVGVGAFIVVFAAGLAAWWWNRRAKAIKREAEMMAAAWRVLWSDIELDSQKGAGKSSMFASKMGFQKQGSISSAHSTPSRQGAGLKGAASTGQFSRASLPGIGVEHRVSASCPTGHCRNSAVALKRIAVTDLPLTRQIMEEALSLYELHHQNVTQFVGACVDVPNVSLLTELCAKGSLEDLLYSPSVSLDDVFVFSLVTDLFRGLEAIHRSPVGSHGSVSSSKCLVTSQWSLKLSGFGVPSIRRLHAPLEEEIGQHAFATGQLKRAPELLMLGDAAPVEGSQAGDVYAAGLVVEEILTRESAWNVQMPDGGPLELLAKVKAGKAQPQPLNATQCVLASGYREPFNQVIQSCVQTDPSARPSATAAGSVVKSFNPYKGQSVTDNMAKMLTVYSTNLEGLVAERTSELEEEKKKTDALLYQMLPKAVADSLKSGHGVQAETFSSCTIYFSDIVGFTKIAGASTPLQVVDLLNDLYTCFDAIIDNHDVYKVETIGDAYMVVSGIPIRNGNRHPGEISFMALDLLAATSTFVIRHMPDTQLQLRAGIHTGSCVAGVVGLKMPRYCLFGDTVNTASRMESGGFALRIHLSPFTAAGLEELGGFKLECRGEIEVKGKGRMTTYYLLGHKDFDKELPSLERAAGKDEHEFK